MRNVLSRRREFVLALLVATSLAVLGSARPAAAWHTPRQTWHIPMVNHTGGLVNDCTVKIMTIGLGKPAPTLMGWRTTVPGWVLTGSSQVGSTLVLTFAGPALGPGQFIWINPDVLIPGNGPEWDDFAWYQWTLNGNPVGLQVPLGFCVDSPPRLGNTATMPDGTPNTTNVVVRNLQFAVSPQVIPNDQVTLDNPAVVSLFSASADPVKPGPFTVTPGNCLTIANVDPSITAPVAGGQSVLAKGTTQDSGGQEYDFVVQFINPAQGPMVSPWGLILLALGMGSLGLLLVWRARGRSRSLRASA